MAYTTIDDPEAYFQVATYTGTSSGAKTVTFAGETNMQPDFIWFKQRNATRSHVQIDSVRGVTKAIQSDTGDAEHTNANYLASFDSDGFTTGSTQDNGTNTSGGTYVAWCWKAGTTSGIGTSGQDITPSAYSINTTSKFGIYAYGGNGTDDSQINHGLGVAPKFIIQKVRSNSDQDWHVFHAKNTSAPETDYLYLNSTAATVDRVESWSDQLPDTTDITLGTSNDGNQSGQTFIMYAWGEVQGFSKFGSYTGSGNSNGPFCFCGFRPAYVMCKVTSGTTNDWTILDNKRDPFNVCEARIYANTTGAESDADRVDFTANGFKIRGDGNDMNGSGYSYIYVAFAEAPFVNSNGVPCNAR